MDITLKYKIVEKIIQTNDDILLNEIKALIGLSENDFWQDLPIEVQQVINQAKLQLGSGECIAHEQVMLEVKDRFLKR